MLWMLHQQLVSGGAISTVALAFFGLHAALFAGVILVGFLAARMSQRLRDAMISLHRPGRRHSMGMLAGMAAAIGLAHIALHGGGA
jgi:hypothetical protein